MGDKMLTQDQLRDLVEHLDESQIDERDAMLLNCLVVCYPTKVGQNQ